MMSKTKTFITTIPFQAEGKLTEVRYEASGNTKLAYEKTTRFPIVPVIAGYAEKGDRIRVIAILTEGKNFRHNYDAYFVPEIEAVVSQGGYEFEGIETVSTPDDESIETQLKLFADIIAVIGDEEDIYACITFGTKPTPIVQTMALNYAYKLKKNASVGCIVYGRYLHDPSAEEQVGTIYDTTALFYMDSIVNRLAEMKAPDPEKAIRLMLNLDGESDA
jgi:hypothetical protein